MQYIEILYTCISYIVYIYCVCIYVYIYIYIIYVNININIIYFFVNTPKIKTYSIKIKNSCKNVRKSKTIMN